MINALWFLRILIPQISCNLSYTTTMSFQSLVSGADCGPINPLGQMLKHTEGDRSLQQVSYYKSK
jgi:hypothetical protein